MGVELVGRAQALLAHQFHATETKVDQLLVPTNDRETNASRYVDGAVSKRRGRSRLAGTLERLK